MKLAKDLSALLALLHSHSVEFVVVGAHAVAFHGFPRFTGGLDLLTSISGVTFETAWQKRGCG